MKRKPSPTFVLVFQGIYPEAISYRKLSDVLNATHKLTSIGELEPSDEDSFSLIGITRGSTKLQCVAHNSVRAIENLRNTGLMLTAETPPDDAVSRVKPIQDLSRIARSLGCAIEWRSVANSDVLARITGDSYDSIAASLLVQGETTIFGQVKRVGGATNLRCVLRLPDRKDLLYCDVSSTDIARMLGEHLYEEVVVSGIAQWIKTSWHIAGFRVTAVSRACRKPLKERFRILRDAGGSAWDNISDSEEYLRIMRGAS